MIELKQRVSKTERMELGLYGFCYGGGKDAPDPPDYGPMASASAANSKAALEAARMSNQTSREQLAWQKEMWADQSSLIQDITDVQLPIMEMQAEMYGEAMEMQALAMEKQMDLYERGLISSERLQSSQLAVQSMVAGKYVEGLAQQMRISEENHQNAMKDRDRYERIFQPIEEDLVQEFISYDTPARQSMEAGRAQADVARVQEGQRKQAMQRLEDYGVDPSQTRSQALDAGLRTQQAAQQALAGNAARQQVENTGRALRAEALNIGKGYPSNVAQSYQTALQGASGAAAPSYSPGAGMAGLQVAGNALSGINSGANAIGAGLNNSMGNLMNAGSAWQGASSQMGSPIQWGGLGQNWMSTSNQGLMNAGSLQNMGFNNQMSAYNAQQANSPWNMVGMLGGAAAGAFLAEGGEVEGPGGPKQDAIPAQLSDGEYVIPEEVVRRKGTEFFDKLIDKTKGDVEQKRMEQEQNQQDAQIRQAALQMEPVQAPQHLAMGGPVYPYDGPAPAAGAPVFYAEGGEVDDKKWKEDREADDLIDRQIDAAAGIAEGSNSAFAQSFGQGLRLGHGAGKFEERWGDFKGRLGFAEGGEANSNWLSGQGRAALNPIGGGGQVGGGGQANSNWLSAWKQRNAGQTNWKQGLARLGYAPLNPIGGGGTQSQPMPLPQASWAGQQSQPMPLPQASWAGGFHPTQGLKSTTNQNQAAPDAPAWDAGAGNTFGYQPAYNWQAYQDQALNRRRELMANLQAEIGNRSWERLPQDFTQYTQTRERLYTPPPSTPTPKPERVPYEPAKPKGPTLSERIAERKRLREEERAREAAERERLRAEEAERQRLAMEAARARAQQSQPIKPALGDVFSGWGGPLDSFGNPTMRIPGAGYQGRRSQGLVNFGYLGGME